MITRNTFECSSCGAQSSKWSGRCLDCGKWGSLEEAVREARSEKLGARSRPAKTTVFADVRGHDVPRIPTKIAEVDRVLGGGIVPGSLILLGGEPGIGKSTIILQIAQGIATRDPFSVATENGSPNSSPSTTVLYCSGEESAEQIKMRLDRLGIKGRTTHYCGETDIDAIIATIREQKPSLAIVDSIQTMRSAEVQSEAGSITQVRAITVRLLETAKATGIPIVIIGHVTKEGSVAGPKTLEHLVDTVLYLEGDKSHMYRLLRAVKNRFGALDEIGVFEMQSAGLQEVQNPSKVFLDEHETHTSGTVVTVAMEGSRPFLVEIQALVTKTVFGYPQRRADGFDTNRLQLLIAVLTERAKLSLGSYDVFLNVAGGFQITEPAADLAIALAIASALKNTPLTQKTVVFGEVGLGGEIRRVPLDEKRRAEAKRFGYTSVIAPPEVRSLTDALKKITSLSS
ncbi:DNA repair protein RadA [Candidatus Uhrbacteria bacterium]|nr:DNA repair protein RadA [Candidatus Uhrbacteria bacterium]